MKMEVSNQAANKAYGSHLKLFWRLEATTAAIIARTLNVKISATASRGGRMVCSSMCPTDETVLGKY